MTMRAMGVGMLLVSTSVGLGQEPGVVANSPTVAEAPMAAMPAASRGSLYKQWAPSVPLPPPSLDPDHHPSPTAQYSFFAVAPQPPRKFKKHDLLTIVVREDSDASSTGKGNSKKQQDFDVNLQQAPQFKVDGNGLPFLQKVSNASNLPELKFNYNNDRKNTADQQRKDTFSARITAEVVDVKPNGNLMLVAIKHIKNDSEEQTFRLTGICRSEDVTADNSVLSTQLGALSLEKLTEGEVTDGTHGGWFNKIWDKVTPF